MNKIAFGRDGRHFLAGIAWSALFDCISDHRSPTLPAWSESPRNVLDIGNAGETWLYQILKIQNVPTYVEDLRYFTLDVTGGQKDKDTLVSNAIPNERAPRS